MPYIDKESRERMKKENELPITEGDKNYIFYSWMLKKWKDNPSYKTIHTIKKELNKVKEELNDEDYKIAIELAFMEFYRRIVIPYEDQVLWRNGDIEV